jgi:Spy/CpxP family protein refolding chaperone
MSRPRIWIILSFLLVFAAGLAAGVFGHNWFSAKGPGDRRGGAVRPPSMEDWAKEVGLTADQQTRLRALFEANDTRMRGDARLKELRTDMSKRYGELRSQLRAEIDAVLTPEQKVKNDAMIKRHQEERRRANAARRDQSPPSGPGRDGRSGGGSPDPQRGPESPDSYDTRTDYKIPFHAYYFKGAVE